MTSEKNENGEKFRDKRFSCPLRERGISEGLLSDVSSDDVEQHDEELEELPDQNIFNETRRRFRQMLANFNTWSRAQDALEQSERTEKLVGRNEGRKRALTDSAKSRMSLRSQLEFSFRNTRRERAASDVPVYMLKADIGDQQEENGSRRRRFSSGLFSKGRSSRGSSVFSIDKAVYDSLMGVLDVEETEGQRKLDTLVEVSKESDHSSVLDEEIEKPSCLICMGKETKTRVFMELPCQKRCNLAPVHKKCIFEWRELKDGKGTCPLCRSPLTAIDYTPMDILHTDKLSDLKYRKQFMLRPVPKEAAMIRAYLKVKHNGFLNSPTDYEFYLQKPCTSKYPGGPLPDPTFPQEGDVLLAYAKKTARVRRFKIVPVVLSSLDIALNNDKDSFTQKSFDFLGYVQANNFVGLEYCVRALQVSEEDDPNELNVGSTSSTANKTKIHGNTTIDKISKYSMFSRRKASASTRGDPVDVACVAYTQNRFGSDSGPRKMKVALPGVEMEHSEKLARLYSMDDNDYDEDEDDYDDNPVPYYTSRLEDPNLLSNSIKPNGEAQQGEKIFLGKNKEPYWLESLEAYSLDFNGRVTLPSNKNFQIELQSEYNAADDIRLQFGKVVEGSKESLYTVDFQWPLSPIQALGICLSSCDRKIGCA